MFICRQNRIFINYVQILQDVSGITDQTSEIAALKKEMSDIKSELNVLKDLISRQVGLAMYLSYRQIGFDMYLITKFGSGFIYKVEFHVCTQCT